MASTPLAPHSGFKRKCVKRHFFMFISIRRLTICQKQNSNFLIFTRICNKIPIKKTLKAKKIMDSDDHDARTIFCANLSSDQVTEDVLYELFLQVCVY